MPAAARAWQAGHTALMMAADWGKAACVELLLAAGADKEAKNDVRRARLAARAGRGRVDGRGVALLAPRLRRPGPRDPLPFAAAAPLGVRVCVGWRPPR